MNRGELDGFKTKEARQNAMVPGIFNESPLRKRANSKRGEGQVQTKDVSFNTSYSSADDLIYRVEGAPLA